MNGMTIKASATVKLLGVVFDQELRWKQHVQQNIPDENRLPPEHFENLFLHPTRHIFSCHVRAKPFEDQATLLPGRFFTVPIY
jgi:hypothetical protein